ncbi:TPA: hypothetical protein U1C81_000568 [Streptococcus suis]|nr:hypothetical protein [Streptococcus suis]HEM3720812.1 hypothetical protein [Streptococcus suis]
MKKFFGLVVLVFSSLFVLVACGTNSITNKVEVSFSGYDGIGVLEYNDTVIETTIKEILLEKVGFKKDEISSIIADDFNSFSLIASSSDNIAKYEKFEKYYNSVEFGFDKKKELSNGEEVTFEIKTSDKNLPIKSEKKQFKVEGLEKSQKVSVKELLDKQYSFTGYNGFGTVSFNNDDQFVISSDQNGHISNDEEVKINILQDYKDMLAKEGKILQDDFVNVKASGLQELSDIKGIQEVFVKISDLATNSNKDKDYSLIYSDKKTYSLEKQKDFLSYSASTKSLFSDKEAPTLTVVSVYKVLETTTYGKGGSKPEGTVETKEYYSIYGYQYIEIINNQLILSDLNSTSNGWTTYDNIESAVLTLERDGYREYVAK